MDWLQFVFTSEKGVFKFLKLWHRRRICFPDVFPKDTLYLPQKYVIIMRVIFNVRVLLEALILHY